MSTLLTKTTNKQTFINNSKPFSSKIFHSALILTSFLLLMNSAGAEAEDFSGGRQGGHRGRGSRGGRGRGSGFSGRGRGQQNGGGRSGKEYLQYPILFKLPAVQNKH